MAFRKPKIDLLAREELIQKTGGKLLLWALTVGRYIAIFTELVVIAGVIARFTLDFQRNNITENLLEQQAILASYQPTELQIRRIHKQLETVAGFESKKLGADEVFLKLSEIIPIDMRFTSFTLNLDSMKISGVTLSLQGFATFISGLYSRFEFSDIILDSIESGGPKDPSLYFSLSINFTRK